MARTYHLLFIALLLTGACSRPEPDMRSTAIVIADAGQRTTLKQWMNANASPALKSANYDKLASVFQTVPTYAPEDPQFTSWNSIAAKGAEAATKRDIEGVRQTCQSCHATHRAAYRTWARGR